MTDTEPVKVRIVLSGNYNEYKQYCELMQLDPFDRTQVRWGNIMCDTELREKAGDMYLCQVGTWARRPIQYRNKFMKALREAGHKVREHA